MYFSLTFRFASSTTAELQPKTSAKAEFSRSSSSIVHGWMSFGSQDQTSVIGIICGKFEIVFHEEPFPLHLEDDAS